MIAVGLLHLFFQSRPLFRGSRVQPHDNILIICANLVVNDRLLLADQIRGIAVAAVLSDENHRDRRAVMRGRVGDHP